MEPELLLLKMRTLNNFGQSLYINQEVQHKFIYFNHVFVYLTVNESSTTEYTKSETTFITSGKCI